MGAAASHFNSAPSFSQEGQEVRFGMYHLYMYYFLGSGVGGWEACFLHVLALLSMVLFIILSIMFAYVFCNILMV